MLFCCCCCAEAKQSVGDESEKVSSSGSEEKSSVAVTQTTSSDSTSVADVKAKVESVEDHKKLNCLGMHFRLQHTETTDLTRVLGI